MANDMGVEQAPIPRAEVVATRWLRSRGVNPLESQDIGSTDVKPGVLIPEAYDLFVEREDLKADIVRKQRQEMEPAIDAHSDNLTAPEQEEEPAEDDTKTPKLTILEQQEELIRQGNVAKLLRNLGPEETSAEVVSMSQARISEVDKRLDEIFSTPGMYEQFQSDLSRQVRIRQQAREVYKLDRFSEAVDLLAISSTRQAKVQERKLTDIETAQVAKGRKLQQVAEERKKTLLSDPEVFDRVRILELQTLKDQLRRDHFAETGTRKKYLHRIEQAWADGSRVLLTGHSGTGKTEMIKHASVSLFGEGPEIVRGNEDTNQYDIIGRVGLNINIGDVRRPGSMIAAWTARHGSGKPVLIDEIDRIPSKNMMVAKELFNIRPGQKGIKPYADGEAVIDVGEDYGVAATANIKSDKYQTANELIPEIARVFDATIDVDYIPASEVYDLALATLMDRRGGIPLSEADARGLLKNLCDGASWIQDAYQGRKIVTNPSSGTFIEERGQATTGKAASLRKAILDPGRTLDMLSGWQAAQVQGISFEDYINEKLVNFINNRAYPEEDRYYLVEIFALKGFLKGHKVSDFMVSDLTPQIFSSWTGRARRARGKGEVAYLQADRVTKLDPYRRFKRPISAGAEDLLGEEEGVQEGEATNIESVDLIDRERSRWLDILGGNVNVEPPPNYLTAEIVQSLERMGMELMYMPALELQDLNVLKTATGGVAGYLKSLTQLHYPKWRPYESLTDAEKTNHKIVRNLRSWYWEQVSSGNVNFPQLPGRWMAVETVEKPMYQKKYPPTEMATKLGLPDDRFNVSWNQVTEAINNHRDIFDNTELGSVNRNKYKLRQLTAIEWNLLANRNGLGASDTYEWVDDEYRESGYSHRLIVGDSDNGGAADVRWYGPSIPHDVVGWRLTVVFEP